MCVKVSGAQGIARETHERQDDKLGRKAGVFTLSVRLDGYDGVGSVAAVMACSRGRRRRTGSLKRATAPSRMRSWVTVKWRVSFPRLCAVNSRVWRPIPDLRPGEATTGSTETGW